MKHAALNATIMMLMLTLTGCSSLLSPATQQRNGNTEGTPARNEVSWQSATIAVPVDTVALRLKAHYGFVSEDDVTAARNSGQGNVGWSASAISEGASWQAQPGSYYRMSRNWAGDDRLTLEVTGNSQTSVISAHYRSSTPAHLKEAWTARLWKQIPAVARHGG
ncbi:hypothetical protein [Erwinia psidii]|uniref:DUF4136 domain-containing protein n=1 Tax=Erwinia psidii TaxID=69224 RepID=A0A3N6RXW1_9GAMM|nr:hypothetical protein [Erwinia psidii]MCX8956982.1 hypothetical protein [Erwinia psidii]MCX8965242.1 hypothetical protein [Erwinia psidii]RQM37958.1 hypothetical protein EB241_11775 [Erwinia psidii]